MAKKMNIWFDKEADFLEISIPKKNGFFRAKGRDIFERVDAKGNVIGFAVFNFSKKAKPKEQTIELPFEFKIKATS